jgi:hypothetical protein
VSWHFEIHRAGKGEYAPGESDRFPLLDERAARQLLAAASDQLDVEVLPGDNDDEIQWLGHAHTVELILLRDPEGLVRLVGAGFRSTGESDEDESRALMRVIFDLADHLEAEVYDQAGARITRAEYAV